MSNENETKAEAFTRLAVPRMDAALKRLELVGNLGGSQYEATDAQVSRIEAALIAKVQETCERLRRTKATRRGFSF